MPELPEVETIKRDLVKKLVGLKIRTIRVRDKRVIRECSESFFIKKLTGKTIQSIDRRGKAIIFSFTPPTPPEGGGGRDSARTARGAEEKGVTSVRAWGSTHPSFLIVQPMMTGQLLYSDSPFNSAERNFHPHTKIVFHLSNNHCLHYNDQRIFGRLKLYDSLDDVKFFQTLGREPFSKSFNLEWLTHSLAQKKTPIKTLLMNQNFVAGIGNIYASEILFHSKIHPQRVANTLINHEIVRLHRMTKAVLNEAIRFRGSSINNYRDMNGQKGRYIDRIQVYDRQGQQCFVCAHPIERFVQSGRSTFYCGFCQK